MAPERRRSAERRAPRSPWLEVRLERLDLHRESRPVLRELSWRILPGQRWVVLGDNGAGKTQLLKLVSGAVWPDPAVRAVRRYRWRGEWHDAPQGVIDEIGYLGPERQDRYVRYDWNPTALQVVGTGLTRSDIPQGPLAPQARARALRWLGRLDAARLARRRLLTLSFGERRLVLLARLLASAPRLLLLDELLAGLDAANRERVSRWLDSTRRSARPWVLTSHRAEEIPAAATHLLRLEAGRIRWQGPLPRGRQARERLFAAWAGPQAVPVRGRRGEASRSRGRGEVVDLATRGRADAPLVRLRRVAVHLDWQPVLRGLDLTVRPGECWVVHGPNGSGKSTLLRAIYGDHPAALGGRIERRGIAPGVPLSEFRRHCAIVAPHLHADYPRETPVLEVVVSGLRSSIGLDEAPAAAELVAARRALRAFGAAGLARRRLASLSYGQVRRVLFARAIVGAPDLLLLDEPFAGVDAASRVALRLGLERLVDAGTAIVMASHHADEWPANASHELQLERGRARWCGPMRGQRDR
ncbi:MAG: ATP-binding cassette domain-containing protein [Steroidobacteraceae bacterium]